MDYWQSLRGHDAAVMAAEPIDRWLARPDIAPALRERLQLAQRARYLCRNGLGLPDNDSYRRYADLRRPAPCGTWWRRRHMPWSCTAGAFGDGLHRLPGLL